MLLVLLALVVFVSPALVGRLAEQSVETQLQWAADEHREIVVTANKFDRGWFSSEGQHRVAIGDSPAGIGLKQDLGFDADDKTPALVIDTRLDHGLIPLASINREEGSLMPGLGRAVSTLSIEMPDGELMKLPGAVYSTVGLDGGLTSRYFVQAGSMPTMSWGAGDLQVESDAAAREISVNGGFDSFTFEGEDGNAFTLGTFDVSSEMTMTEYGYSVGDLEFSIDTISLTSPGSSISLGPIDMDASTALDGDRVNATTSMDFAMSGVPPIGDIAWGMDLTLHGLDAGATGRLQRSFDNAGGVEDPTALYGMVERDLLDLAARGFEMRFDRLDVTLPQGTVFTTLTVSLPESDRQSFSWPGALLAMRADAAVRVPVGLYEFAAMMNPQANALVAMGFLKKNGENYEMTASYAKGLLTVNGAPMPIPIPGT